MRDQEEHADTESEVQMGTTRADGRRRFDEEAWGQYYDVTIFAGWCLCQSWTKIESWQREVYRETHKRKLWTHQQVEQVRTGEYNQRNVVGCSHTLKVDEANGSDP